MEFNPIEISCSNQNNLNVTDLVRQIFQASSRNVNFTSLQSSSSEHVALLDFYNDIKNYKDAIKKIQKAQSEVTNVQQCNIENVQLDHTLLINSLTAKNYHLLRPINLLTEKASRRPSKKKQKSQCYLLPERKSSFSSETTVQSDSNINDKTSALTKRFMKSIIIKTESTKTILVAEPETVEFHNYEADKTYKKTVIVRNIDKQLARFKIGKRPDKSAFVIFVESARKGGEKEDIAPGMHIKLIIHFKCDTLREPEELLALQVQNGKSISILLRGRRDPPTLKALSRIFVPSYNEQFIETNSTNYDSGITSSSCKTESFTNSEDLTESTDSSLIYGHMLHTSFECTKCFVGEYMIVLTILKNVGGKGRFFIMSEIDWCSMKIMDLTVRNMLMVPPFAIWPAYFSLEPNEELTLYTYFFPDSYGLQVDELYIISDNCSIKTMEVIGDGIIFEPQSLEFDKTVKYQWFQTSSDDHFCTLRYVDLGSGICYEFLSSTFSVTSKCELELYYRWEVDNTLLCPKECKNTIRRKPFPLDKIIIEPSCGTFQLNSAVTFQVTAILRDITFGQYRSTLRLIIEDLPLDAVSEKFETTFENSKVKRRLCENSVDVVAENIEIRVRCLTPSAAFERREAYYRAQYSEGDLIMIPIDDLLDDSCFDLYYNKIDDDQGTESSKSDDVCRFIKGYGTCDCCQAELVSTAVIRLGSPVFLSVESTATAVLRNNSSKRVKYWWGNAVGAHHTKMKIKIDPLFDTILPKSCQIVTFKFLPLETGDVSSIFIPCQFDGLNPLIVSVECTIKALSIAFYFPTTCEEYLSRSSTRITWDASEFLSKFDKKTGQIRVLKPKLKEERLLHTIKLNSIGSAFPRDSEIKSSSDSYENEEENKTDDEQEEIEANKLDETFEFAERTWSEEEEYESDDDDAMLLPYFDFKTDFVKRHFRYLPLIIEFNVKPGICKKKRIYIQNESPISSTFSIITKNFWNDGKLDADKDNISDDSNELKSGLVLNVEPMKGDIKPYDTIFFDVIASSNTWGVYTDQITININLVPPYVFWVRIINDISPIYYPICRNSPTTIPKIRFNIIKAGCNSGIRRLLIENTSAIPLYVNWTCFLINEDVEEKPFNLVLDMITPFISIDEFLAMNTHFYDAIQRFFSCAFNPYKPKDNVTEINELKEPFKASNSSNSIDESLDSNFSIMKLNIGQSSDGKETTSSSLSRPENNENNKNIEGTELQLSIVPYYGIPIYDLFVITPQEVFLPPKEKRYIQISMNTEKLKNYGDRVLCKACGFIRIPPIFKYKDNVFFRKDGYYLPPTEVDLECHIKKNMLFMQSSMDHRTFEFHMKDFIRTTKNEIQAKKRILFTNLEEEIIDVGFSISEPFEISRISTPREVFHNKNGTIHPNESIEVEIKCKLKKTWIEKAVELNQCENRISTCVTVNKILSICYGEGTTQSVKMYIKLHLPSFKISTNCLNFGVVEVGDTKILTFDIQNVSEQTQCFEIRQDSNKNFKFYPTKALLTAEVITGNDNMEITAYFSPKKTGLFKEVIEIIAEKDGLISKCFLEGEAIVRRNYTLLTEKVNFYNK